MHAIRQRNDGIPEDVAIGHGLWIVASQDCDLDSANSDSNEPSVELRPLFDGFGGSWGIRSRKLRVQDQLFLDANAPKCHISPAALQAHADRRRQALSDYRTRALKTWLGLRYDRPAVPDSLVALAKEISKSVEERAGDFTDRIEDVLMQFDESASPARFSLFDIITDPRDEAEVREWLAEIGLSISSELGIGDTFEARAKSEISLELIETSYAADTTQLTWRGEDAPSG